VRPALANIITARVPEADLLIDTMTVRPQGNRAFLISDTIRRLKAADIWSRLDVLWMLAAHDAQAARLNWKNPASFALTAVNSPTFTADRGYAGDGTTSYLDTSFVIGTHAVQYTRDSASLGAYLNAGTDTAAGVAYGGVIDGVGTGAFGQPITATNKLRGRVNAAGSGETPSTVLTRLGLSVLDRAISTDMVGYRNGASLGSVASASVPVPVTLSCWWCGVNNGLTLASPLDNRIAMGFYGASLTATQHTALYNIINAHLRAIGAA
jgi:hypothetical protein